jgi:8-oxo-dGTP pyrophosphatase MutT (NUDIX family)
MATATARCDNASVGVLIAREDGRYLMFDRATFPAGVAPCAGHVFDAHAGYADAARAEVREELGLTVERLEPTTVGGWRPNRCRRQPGPRGPGHDWRIYTAAVSGTLTPSRETRNARWLDRGDMQRLADRTASYAHGELSGAEFRAAPGIEPVWVGFLDDLGLIRMSAADLTAIWLLTVHSAPEGAGTEAV